MRDVSAHAAAMKEIAEALRPFTPEERLVMISGELGNVLCGLGPKPDRHTAVAMIGTAIQMAFSMIDQRFPAEKFDA